VSGADHFSGATPLRPLRQPHKSVLIAPQGLSPAIRALSPPPLSPRGSAAGGAGRRGARGVGHDGGRHAPAPMVPILPRSLILSISVPNPRYHRRLAMFVDAIINSSWARERPLSHPIPCIFRAKARLGTDTLGRRTVRCWGGGRAGGDASHHFAFSS